MKPYRLITLAVARDACRLAGTQGRFRRRCVAAQRNMRRLDTPELEAVAAIAEVKKRGAVMLVAPGGGHIRIFPAQRITPSLHKRIRLYFEQVRSILLSLASPGDESSVIR